MKESNFKVKEKAKVSPALSGLEKWVEGIIIKIFNTDYYFKCRRKCSLKYVSALYIKEILIRH
jgi:hypothetical protein